MIFGESLIPKQGNTHGILILNQQYSAVRLLFNIGKCYKSSDEK